MNLEILQAERLFEAQSIAAELFPWEREHQHALAVAVRPNEHRIFLAERGLESIRCWTSRTEGGDLCGLATLYAYEARPDEVWLAWYGLAPVARGRGIGSALLDCVIQQADREGRRTLRLWTTDETEYDRARSLYVRRGFNCEPHPALPGEDWATFVYSLGLGGTSPCPWALVSGRKELCGREVPNRQAVAA